MVMPALPGAHLVVVHPRFALSSSEAGFNAGSSFDDPRQLCPRRLLQLPLGHTRWCEVITVAIPGVLIAGLARGLCLKRPLVREGPPGDHQPLRGSRAFPFP